MHNLTSQSLTSQRYNTVEPDGWIMSRGTEQHVKAGLLTNNELQLPRQRDRTNVLSVNTRQSGL